VYAEALTLELTRVPTRRPTLKADKGINLPDTDLNSPAFTSNDTKIFRFIAQHADMVGLRSSVTTMLPYSSGVCEG
jgi:pyruvate kinase